MNIGNLSPAFCNQPWDTIYIRWNGHEVMPCCYHYHNLGDIAEQSYEEIWNGTKYQMLRNSLIEKDVQGSCLPCYHQERPYADHLNPFLGQKFNDIKEENLKKLQKNYFEKKCIIDNLPTVIYMDMSSTCKLRCRKCFTYNREDITETGHMPLPIFQKIEPLLPTTIRVICTGIGESLLNPYFEHMVTSIRKNDCQITFNTSGNPLDKHLCEVMVSLGVTEISFSIDSIKEDIYAYHHRGGSLQKVLENLNSIKFFKEQYGKTQPKLNWYFVGMKSNIRELIDIVDTSVMLGFGAIYVAPLNPPIESDKQFYLDFYSSENLIENSDDRELLMDMTQRAKLRALERGISFVSGYDTIFASDKETRALISTEVHL